VSAAVADPFHGGPDRDSVVGMGEALPVAPPALLDRLRAGEESAFEEIVRSFSPRMIAVARRLMRGNEEDARDAVQDAFLSAFRSLAGFSGACSLGTWLHRITVNAALMKLRTRRRRPEVALEDLLPRFSEDGHYLDPPTPWHEQPEVMLERDETKALVRAAIEELPAIYREVLLLRDIAGLDNAEAAESLGITRNAAKIRLHRAHQALRTLLERRLGRNPS